MQCNIYIKKDTVTYGAYIRIKTRSNAPPYPNHHPGGVVGHKIDRCISNSLE